MPKINGTKWMKHRYARFLQYYAETRMHIQKSCKLAGISRANFYKWMKNPDFAAEIEALEESILDECEEKLKKFIEEGDKEVILLWLKHKGKHRGWGEPKQQIEQTGAVQLEIVRKIMPNECLDVKIDVLDDKKLEYKEDLNGDTISNENQKDAEGNGNGIEREAA